VRPGGTDLCIEHLGAADIVSWTAWASPLLRRLWLGTRLRRLERKVKALDDRSVKYRIDYARRWVR
jgi:hypothetical protein